MAAAVVPAPPVDLRAPGNFNVRLGASISKGNEGKRYRNVRYNHKPRSAQGATATTKLLPGKQANASTLLVKDEDKEWKYRGRHTEGEDMYVLVLGGEGNKDVVLEKLDSSHAVNLTQSPDDNDEKSLAKKHPYLTDNESDDDDDGIFGDEGDAEETAPDADNPFDFRHFLKSVEEASKREEASSQPSRSTVGTPLQRAAINTSVSRPTKSTPAAAAVKKRKTPSAAATRPNPKRVRAGEDPPNTKPPTSNPSTSKPAAPAVPQVRIDRKPSMHMKPTESVEQTFHPEEPDYEDDGELILENSSADNTKQNSRHLLGISGGLSAHGGGPISLRSAASSPGVNSPQINASASQSKEEGEEFDFGGGSSPAPEQYEFEFVDDDGDDEDGDVEDLELQSPTVPEPPRQPAMPSRSRRGSLAGPVGDDDDDMEAQLALAMAADEDDEEPAPRLDESDEDVSEEE